LCRDRWLESSVDTERERAFLDLVLHGEDLVRRGLEFLFLVLGSSLALVLDSALALHLVPAHAHFLVLVRLVLHVLEAWESSKFHGLDPASNLREQRLQHASFRHVCSTIQQQEQITDTTSENAKRAIAKNHDKTRTENKNKNSDIEK
jgi:hypothetical protein